MTDHLYVATSADGIEHTATGEIAWRLPDDAKGAPGATTTEPELLVLRRPAALLDALDEVVYRAQALGDQNDLGDRIETKSARLVAKTRWDTDVAARFAIDCAEHALEGAEHVALPDGEELAPILAGARLVLERDERGPDETLGFLARLAAVRRLRKVRDALSDAVLASTTADLGDDLDAVDDPKWATLAAGQEAVLAALEAVRHVALPRYVRSREEAVDEHPDDQPPTSNPQLMTPWGPIVFGAEHQSPYVAAWVAARDAAMRAREAAQDRGGDEAEAAELAWQASRLEEVLEAA
ncbi:MAG: hypothetical protein WCF24_08425 [Acidimicrobiales bacterium]